MSGNLRSLPRFGSAQRLAVRVALGLVLAGGLSIAQAQEVVGKVLMAIGRVEVQRDGKAIAAKKDTEIFAGDTITTGSTSNAQVRFKDGAVVAFRPETEFRVDEYKYSGKPDGTEKAAVSLVKGGVRAVTGAIGRSNRDNLKVNAVVATVGIRGTGFNITFCGASCKAANPNANEGLYAGVFEGKVSVSNQGGSTSELGVNRFAYVRDEKTAPILLIAPPSFLKDSLESQVRIRPKDLGVNAASENSASLQNANATVKAPATGGQTETISADRVQKVPTPLTQIEIVNDYPSKFFEVEEGSGILPAVGPITAPTYTVKLRTAEFKPGTTSRQINLNQDVTSFTSSTVSGRTTVEVYAFNNTYSINSTPQSSGWREGGRDGEAIAWGRWGGSDTGSITATIGAYGSVTLENNQGWHYIYGPIATVYPGGSVTMSLIGGTTPTELRAGAESGWRLTGGTLNVNYATKALTGLMQLYAGKNGGYANFDMTWSGAINNSPGILNSYDTTTTKTSGSLNLCTGGCTGTASVGFYGVPKLVGGAYQVEASRAGVTYQFNTGSYEVQGVAVYK